MNKRKTKKHTLMITAVIVAIVALFVMIVSVIVATNGNNNDIGSTENGVNSSDNINSSGSSSGGTITNNQGQNSQDEDDVEYEEDEDSALKVYRYKYTSTTAVGYNAEYLGTVKRNIPKTSNEGLVSQYPTYGKTLTGLTTEEKENLVKEANLLCSKSSASASGSYDMMDKEGYLYLSDGTKVVDDSGNHRKLYKHTAADSMYFGSGISNNEKAIVKRVTLSPRGYGSYSVTGVYAPAGEVITIQISEADMKATGGITVYIGQTFYSGNQNNLSSSVNPSRMPVISNTMQVNTTTATLENGVYTAYVGSYLGGPIYIGNTSSTVTVTISGGVRYSHFILGYTTQEEYEENAKSSAPYFDLEVRDYGILHSGAKKYVQSYSYEDIYNAAVMWEKITLISTQGVNQGISLLYDTYIPNGYYAISFVGWRTTILPSSLIANALNYNGFTKSGSWAIIHEYNHHFQHYGAGFSTASDEITNNALNVVEYSLYTTISAERGVGNYGAENLSDWSRYLSATWSLQQVLSRIGNSANKNYYKTSSGLAMYSTLLHNLGQDNFMQAKVVQQSTNEFNVDYDGYLAALTQVTHYNMSYFFNSILGAEVDEDFINTYTDKNYPMFVPVSCIYQTGRSLNYDGEKKYIQTMQPYKIPYSSSFTIDFSKYTLESSTYAGGSVVLPDGFSYKIKSVSQPESGSISKLSNYVYTYTPGTQVKSGKIYVTLEITKDDNEFEVADVDLVLEFQQSHEVTKYVLEKTVYNYTENFYDSTKNKFTTTAAEAFNNNFAGYFSVTTGNNINPTNASTGKVIQDCNSDVWFVDTLQNDGNNTNDGVVDSNIKTQVVVLSGKIYASEAGKYRISLRGRMNVALFVSKDGTTYEKAVDYTSTNASNVSFPTDLENGYMDINMDAGSWLYFKAVLVRYYGEPRNAFMGVGWGKWTEEEGEIEIDSDGNPVYSEDYVAPTVTVSYATAYRTSYTYIADEKFTSDYLYTRNYSYTYSGVTTYDVGQQAIEDQCVFSQGWEHPLSGLFDGNSKTYMHSSYAPTTSRPVTIVAQLDSPIMANRLIFDGSHNSENKFLPKDFKIWVSNDGQTWQLVSNVEGSTLSSDGWQVVVQFDGTYTFSYYKFEITATHNQYIALREIILQYYEIEIPSGTQLSPDNDMFTYVGDWGVQSTYSTFGHVYVGKTDSTLEFEFEGTRLGILSTNGLGANFKVEIDGEEVSSIYLVAPTSVYASYVSTLLSSGTHKVVITCQGETNIDSIVTW
jgi:hypothetical protein